MRPETLRRPTAATALSPRPGAMEAGRARRGPSRARQVLGCRPATDREADASLVACACGELCAEPRELTVGPLGFERLIPRVVPVDDRLPSRRALLKPVLALEQERAAVQGTDVLGIELERATPIAERPLHVTAAGLR